ncbi:hypothetical protein MUN88_18505 [Gracilibacillus caseinilyticus]|uniref:YkyB-like protein n=1 Tax=Gracilibacillus caseinilyticus TaxID=2932256 RepID=A0ABY4EUE0_9BACI|nr:YkyB family protein [Gracilibacillus caseinilyticus]UOQ48021.1 hypothetical protein MUN88_18505 [Gracilibacillus caseinilyticus]
MEEQNPEINEIGHALFIVNRHAKTALDPTQLYQLKNETMKKLLADQKAVKVGLHFSNNPKQSRQHSVLLVQVGSYYFHMPPSKNDMQALNHLGNLDDSYRNPKPSLSLTNAKKILLSYLNWPASVSKQKQSKPKPRYSPFTNSPSSLSPFYHKRKRW